MSNLLSFVKNQIFDIDKKLYIFSQILHSNNYLKLWIYNHIYEYKLYYDVLRLK